MLFDPALLSSLSRDQEQDLRLALPDQVGKCVVEHMNLWFSRSYSDIDELLYAGAAVGRSNHKGIDGYIEEWIEANPSDLRIDIASLFLWGYWPFVAEINKSLAEKLLGALQKLPKESAAYASALLGLFSAFKTKKYNMSNEEYEAGYKLLKTQREILRKMGIHPGILDTLDELP